LGLGHTIFGLQAEKVIRGWRELRNEDIPYGTCHKYNYGNEREDEIGGTRSMHGDVKKVY
jgi:hypothetical protein